MIDTKTIHFIEERLDEKIDDIQVLADTKPSRLFELRGRRRYVLKQTKRVPLHRQFSTQRRVFDLCRDQTEEMLFSVPEPYLLEPEGRFMLMEYVEGDTLLNRLCRREPGVEDLFHQVGAGLQQYHRLLTARFNDVKTDLREYPFMAEVLATRHGPAIQARLARFPAESDRVLYKDITPANVVVSPSRRIYFVDVQEDFYGGPFYYDLARFVDTTLVFSIVRNPHRVWTCYPAARRAAAAFLAGYGQTVDETLLKSMQYVHRWEHVHIKRTATPCRALVLKVLYTVL